MSTEHGQQATPRPGSRAPAIVCAVCAALLAGALISLFCLSYRLLIDHPTHAPGLIGEVYAALAVGLLALALQTAFIYLGLARPLRESALRIEQLSRALDQYSHRDPLTGALNRTAFDQLITRELEALRRYQVSLCGIMVDVDSFRAYNEAHGYEMGDQMLFELARELRRHMRKADFLFRWRSGRFAILASGISQEQGQRFAEKLRDMLAALPHRHGAVSACLGVAQARPEDSPELFVARVKDALAQAKEQGPGNVAVARA